MYLFRFKLPIDHLVGTEPRPLFRYRLVDEHVGPDVANEHLVFEAATVYPTDITTIWPHAYDLEKIDEAHHYRYSSWDGWILPTIELKTGLFRIQFCLLVDDARPVKYPPPYQVWQGTSGVSYDVWVGYFDSVSQLMEYWPGAFCVDITDGGIEKSDLFKYTP